jgi:DNA-binding transcriptional regulator YiaG
MKHKEFAKTLVAWRERNDYTQQDAADNLGVSRRSLENWEQERAMPQGFGLQAMLKTIKVAKAPQAPKPKSRKRQKRQH